MRLEIEQYNKFLNENRTLRSTVISENRVILSDGGTYFVSVTREELVELLREMDDEIIRNQLDADS